MHSLRLPPLLFLASCVLFQHGSDQTTTETTETTSATSTATDSTSTSTGSPTGSNSTPDASTTGPGTTTDTDSTPATTGDTGNVGGTGDTGGTGPGLVPPALDESCFDTPNTEYFHRYFDGFLPPVTDGSVTPDCEVLVQQTGAFDWEYTDVFDSCGRLTERTAEDGSSTLYRHETSPGVHTVWLDAGADGIDDNQTVHVYDSNDLLVSTTRTNLSTGDVQILTFSYDVDGNLILREDSTDYWSATLTHTITGDVHLVETDVGMDGTTDEMVQTTPTATGREHLKGTDSLDHKQVITVDADGRDILREHTDVDDGDWQGTDTFTHDSFGRLATTVSEQPNRLPITTEYTWSCPW